GRERQYREEGADEGVEESQDDGEDDEPQPTVAEGDAVRQQLLRDHDRDDNRQDVDQKSHYATPARSASSGVSRRTASGPSTSSSDRLSWRSHRIFRSGHSSSTRGRSAPETISSTESLPPAWSLSITPIWFKSFTSSPRSADLRNRRTRRRRADVPWPLESAAPFPPWPFAPCPFEPDPFEPFPLDASRDEATRTVTATSGATAFAVGRGEASPPFAGTATVGGEATRAAARASSSASTSNGSISSTTIW